MEATNPSPLFRLLRCGRCPRSFQTREGKTEHLRTAHGKDLRGEAWS